MDKIGSGVGISVGADVGVNGWFARVSVVVAIGLVVRVANGGGVASSAGCVGAEFVRVHPLNRHPSITVNHPSHCFMVAALYFGMPDLSGAAQLFHFNTIG